MNASTQRPPLRTSQTLDAVRKQLSFYDDAKSAAVDIECMRPAKNLNVFNIYA
jgi:hypothetical protein